MIISVASGKGGTGKTTVATNLVFSLAGELKGRVQILDCDVEEPNAHLFIKPRMEKTETVYAPVPEIDEDKCVFCGKCAEICRFNAIAMVGKTILSFPELCHSCGGCVEVCPEGAVSETGRELGILESGSRGKMAFVHGKLRVGEAMSPPLIKKVRSLTDPDAVSIIDAPPGTSCPVIAATRGSDFVLMATEPTPFGLHDLKLGVEAVRELDLPCGLVINRCDVGNDDVREYARKEGIPVLMEIPFDRDIARMYSRGEMAAEKAPLWREKFVALFEKIAGIIKK
ncbi:(4Fe-4S)-binding protein [Candidatus Desulfarcum epimagneticum]|uniref:(4Fe-4S)-binding protein n=1 Tax=uncultured Desulfobacteraceae bacterium TaxID=218296 RepID=A0A484HKD9_9BACT|nr:(4Fe-4S)-binding protein [uncultured Desulfobacteraceae bacterium]